MAYSDIKDPSAHFQTALYSGTAGANNAVTNDGNSDLKPDWLLFKHRTASNQDWYTVDSSRGSTKGLATNTSAGETTSSSATKDFQSFNTDGFTVGTPEDTNATNSSGTHAAWQWKCNGGTTSTNTTGNGIDSVVQVNTTAGFSIVTYTGNGTQSGQTVGHGLGAVPKWIISKDRNASSNVPNWRVYHEGIANTKYITLDTDAVASTYNDWDNTSPTSSVYSVGGAGGYTPTNNNNTPYVAYVFAAVQGFSKFGTYVGNGNVQGPFVYTGFKPACIITKTVNATEGWGIYDNKRLGFNVWNDALSINSQAASYGGSNYNFMDILSNGFKMRRATYGPNASANYIYMAFAENPFVAGGVPTTAR